MRLSFDKTMLIGLLAVSAPTVNAHPSREVLAKFAPHFRCPYANEWVANGPEQAALNLGLLNATSDAGRRAQETTSVAGSCTYTNSWTNTPSCLEMRGDSWTEASMTERCAGEADSTLSPTAPCEVDPANLAGYCVVEADGIEATPMPLEDGDCNMAQTACQNFMSGSFSQGEGCGGAAGGPPPEVQEGGGFPFAVPASSEPVSCAIAPGAIGAAHQAANSPGYSTNCEGTPAEGSPYMWPNAWKTHAESKAMAFGSDDVLYHSKGITYYRLDKNWKRSDTYFQRGVQRSLGQGPCAPEDAESTEGPLLACRRDSDDYGTMIHRGSKMFFIDWKNGTEVGSSDPSQIADCNWLNLQVVGNIRNDWFMDDRGDSTDVQYLGDQHVFYEGNPRLVKQWRKKDFANQYFVMSVQANVKQDGIHWPMILNVPGEGFGDDFLQIYQNQTVLTDEDDYLFLLDEALEALGGEVQCKQMEMGGGGGGPPTGETVHIPSNLEVDPNSWFTNVYTYSPVWQPPVEEDTQSMATGSTGMATTREGDITVKSCYDESAKAVQLSFEFANIEMIGSELPWMALGYRETEECLMTPRGGGDTEMILLGSSEDGDVDAHFTMLPPLAKSFDGDAVSSIYDNMAPLGSKEGYSDVDLHLPTTESAITKSAHNGADEDSVVLHFKQSMPEGVPEAMHLMYAIGSTPEIGYHKTRKCFDITEFPTCPTTPTTQDSTSNAQANDLTGEPVSVQSSAGHMTVFAAVTSTFFALFM